MMDNDGSSSSAPAVDWENDIDVDLDRLFQELSAESFDGSVMNSGVDAAILNLDDPSLAFMSIINGDANSGEGSSNVSESGISQEMMTGISQEMMTVGSLTPNSSTTTIQSEGIISSAVKLISDIFAQSSQSQTNTEIPQSQPLIQEISKGKAVEQPIITTQPLTNQSNMTFCDQINQPQYQMSSNQFLSRTTPMVVNTLTELLQNNQGLNVQMQQNLNQNHLQLQQAIGSSSSLNPGARQLGTINNINLRDPIGFIPPDQFDSTTAFREYALREIKTMKERYSNELLKMHYNSIEMRMRTTNADLELTCQKVQISLEQIMTFLNISRVELLPKDDEAVYEFMNRISNDVSRRVFKPNRSFQLVEPSRLPPIGPRVQPMNFQKKPSPNSSQRVSNPKSNMLNFNKKYPSRRLHPQPTKSRMSSSLHSFKSPQLSNSRTTQQTSSGSKTLFTNTSANNLPSRLLNHQPPLANQNFNLGKMKAPMHNTNEFIGSKPRYGMSPLCSALVNNRYSSQFSPPTTVNPTNNKPTFVSSLNLNVNKVLSPLSMTLSPFLVSSSASTLSIQNSSCISSSSTVDGQKAKTPMDPPSPKSKDLDDLIFHLTEVVKSVSPNTLRSTLSDINSMDNITDILLGEMNVMLEYDHEQLEEKIREFNVALMDGNPFVSQECDINSSEISTNKKMRIETEWAILEEIKETNYKLLETSINVMTDISDEDINILGAQEGTIIKCLFKNFCFPDLLDPQVTSQKMPEFVILIIVPADYPASPPKYNRSSCTLLNGEPWGKLYEEMLTKFDLSLYGGVTGKVSLGDMARNWNASVRGVLTEFMEKKGFKSFSSRYGIWEKCSSG